MQGRPDAKRPAGLDAMAYHAFPERPVGADRHRLELIGAGRLQAGHPHGLRPGRPDDAYYDGDYDHCGRSIRANALHGLHPDNSARIHGPMPIAGVCGLSLMRVDRR
jgi:hypothetical protein